jgi:Oxidoreductase family, NAD-binding Rossmann fold
MSDINRRTFLTGISAAAGLTIVPRRVLGGQGFVAPSDMIRLAQVGCGTQAQRQVNTELVARPDIQIVAVVDPNRDSQNYVDWSEMGNRNQIRQFLGEPGWGASDKGIRAGREVAKEIMEIYYRKQQRPGGIRTYEDYREMLEKENDIQGVINITPDHQHGSINIAALKKGRAAISHKPVASVLYEVRRTVDAARASSAPSHLLAYSNNPDQYTLAVWIGRSGRRACRRTTCRAPRFPMDSTGSSGKVRSRIASITRAIPLRSIEAGTRTARAASATWVITVSGSPTEY